RLPIITKPLDRNTMSEDELQIQRATVQETFVFITGELEDIVNNEALVIKYNAGERDASRATLGAALALKGWVELFGASPLFNTASSYLPDPGNFVHFGNNDQARWKKAADTNRKFIETFGDGQHYDLFQDISNFWRVANEYNSEVIWDRQVVANVGGMGRSEEHTSELQSRERLVC